MLKALTNISRSISITAILLFSALSLNGETLAIDKGHSEVGFSIKHLMISSVKGKFTEYDGDIKYDLKSKNFTKFDTYVETKSIDTGITKRDNHLRSSDFFEAKKYPKLTFKMDSYENDGDEGVLVGNLTIHGVTKRVKLEVENNGSIKDLKGNTRIGFTITGKINRKDFGLTWNKALEAGGVVVGDKVKIIIELQTIVVK